MGVGFLKVSKKHSDRLLISWSINGERIVSFIMSLALRKKKSQRQVVYGLFSPNEKDIGLRSYVIGNELWHIS